MEKLRSEIKESDRWDLSYLVKDEKDIETKILKLNKLFDKVLSYKGKIMDSSKTLYNFYQDYLEYEKISEDLLVYAIMHLDEDTSNVESQTLKQKITKILEDQSPKLSFINPEMLKTPYDKVLEYLKENKDLEPYRFDLENTFRYQKHVLSEEKESLISEATKAFGVPSEAFSALDNTDINLGKIKDEEGKEVILTNSNYIKYMNSKNREVRKQAFYNMYKYWESLKNTVSILYKGKVKEDFFTSNIRKFTSPLEASLFSDNISVKLYKALIQTVHKNMDKMYKYVLIRKKLLGHDELHFYDIYVDLIEEKEENIEFVDGKKQVFEALKPLGEEYLKDLEKAFEERWIDIYPNKGKRSGAYKFGTYNSKPYVLLNYEGTRDSVSTMAHELGHAMHSYYSNKKQDYINHDYPIFLAEIASTVNEILLNDYLIKNAKTKEEKILYITDFLEKIKSTLFRQTMFAEFEMIIHDKEQKGIPLTEKEMSDTYYDLNKLYFGENMYIDKEIRYEWMRIPHFYTPFYVYKYATGISAAVAIASNIINGGEEERKKYIDFLSSGGSDYPLNILKNVGIDMESGEPIQKALDMFLDRLNELEEICN